jgi:uncharacterized membrane protein YgcG
MKRNIMAAAIVLVVIGVVAVSAYAYMANASPYTGPTYTQGIDYALYGFPTVLASQTITPGVASSVSSGPYLITIPAGAFVTPVKFELLSGDASNFAADAPSGTSPELAFAFRVTDLQSGQLIGSFNAPVTVDVKDSSITVDSSYYNVDTAGTYTINPSDIVVSDGELTHSESSALVGWVVTTPATRTPQGQVPDYTNYRFVVVLSSQIVNPGTPATITGGPYTVSIPANAFSSTVKFDLLTGDPSAFASRVPAGEQAVADYAFRVTDQQTGRLVGTFNAPVTVEVKDASITKDSKYYNADTTGGLTLNTASLQLSSGDLMLSNGGAMVGWVITTPASEVMHGQSQQISQGSQSPGSQAPDYTNYGFPTVLGYRMVYPGSSYDMTIGPYTVNIPSDAFSTPVEFDLLAGSTGTLASGAPAGVTPMYAFAFRVTDLNTGQLIGTFNDAVTVSIYSSDVTSQSAYYNIDTLGRYSLNTASPQTLSNGLFTVSENTAQVGWVLAQNIYSSGGGSMGYTNGGSSYMGGGGYSGGGGGY